MTSKFWPSTKQLGFSMVELMVAIAIGLIILAAVSTVFVSSKTTYNTQDNLAKLQENARFAMQFIIRDLRLAGYFGCNDDLSRLNSTLNDDFAINLSSPLEGMNDLSGTVGTWYPSGDSTAANTPVDMKENTDAFILRMADPNSSVDLTSPMPNPSAELNVSSAANFQLNEIMMISDCGSADITQITQVQDPPGKLQHNPGGGTNPGNKTGKPGWLSKPYSPPATVLKFLARRYYVSKTGTLIREDNGTAQPLVDGITDMQIQYGKDTDSDRVPNIYLDAGIAGLQSAGDWANIKSARVTLTVTAPDDPSTSRTFSTTVQLRNL